MLRCLLLLFFYKMASALPERSEAAGRGGCALFVCYSTGVRICLYLFVCSFIYTTTEKREREMKGKEPRKKMNQNAFRFFVVVLLRVGSTLIWARSC